MPAMASAPTVTGDDLVIAAAGSAAGLTVALSVTRVTPGGTSTTIPMGASAVASGFPDNTVVAPFAGDIAVVFQSAAGPVLALVAP